MTVNFGSFKNVATQYYAPNNILLMRQVFAQVKDQDKVKYQPLLDKFPDKIDKDFLKITVTEKNIPLESSFLMINGVFKKIVDLTSEDIPLIKMAKDFLGKISKQTEGFEFDLPPKKALERLGVYDNFDDEMLRDKSIYEGFDSSAVNENAQAMEESLGEKLAESFKS